MVPELHYQQGLGGYAFHSHRIGEKRLGVTGRFFALKVLLQPMEELPHIAEGPATTSKRTLDTSMRLACYFIEHLPDGHMIWKDYYDLEALIRMFQPFKN